MTETTPEPTAPEPQEPVVPAPTAAVEAPALYDPSDHTVDHVLAFLAANPEQTERVLNLEAAGKRRKTLLGDDGRVEDSPLLVESDDEREARLNAERVAEVEYNPDGEWLAPVDSSGKMLVTETGQPVY